MMSAPTSSPRNDTYHPFSQGFCSDYLWDPYRSWYTEYPDLTLCFQKTLLVWVPCLFLWLTLPVKVRQGMGGKYHIDRWTHISSFKMVASLLLAAVCMVDLFYAFHVWRTGRGRPTPSVDIIEPLIKSATFLLAGAYIFIDKRRAKPSSAVLFIFWFLTSITGAIRFRTVLESAIYQGIPEFLPFLVQMLYLPLIVAQFLLSCFAEYFPELDRNEENPCPERFSSVPNRLTFWWFTGLVYRGWRQPLVQSDLWDVQARDLTLVHSTRLQKNWNYEVAKSKRSEMGLATPEEARKGRKAYAPSLTRAILKSIWVPFAFTFVLRVLNDGCVFIAPQVLKLLIGFVSDPSQEAWKGYVYISGLFLGTLSQILLFNHYFYISHRTGMHIRSALINAVYQKALKLSNSAKRRSTVGEIVNLMAVDSQKFSELVGRIQILWAAPIQIAVALYFLWQELGPAVLGGLGVMITLIPLNSFLIRKLRALQAANMKDKDNRIKMMNEVLSGMKILKLYAWEEYFQNQILRVRDFELRTLFKTAYINATSMCISILSPFLVALVSFSTYVLVDSTHKLTPGKAFVSLSLFNILRQPVGNLPDVITAVVQAQVSIKRLTKFLLNEELDPENVLAVDRNDKSFTWGLKVTNGSFTWDAEAADTPCLRNINIDIPQGSLVAVVGQVGSGKSSLCAAILGLMEKTSGQVQCKGSVAYVSQQAWIQNLSLKENILFGLEYNDAFYHKVIDACALQPDLDVLPAGDLTEIGEKGINLSGGQKQRVSLARAVYSRADIYVLDDPLSAVDAHVGKHIFDEIIGPTGLLADKTRILVTHGIGFLPKTDQIIVLIDGSISEVGSYKELLYQKKAFAEFLTVYLAEAAEENPETAVIKAELIQEIGSKPALERGVSIVSQVSLRKVKAVLEHRDSKMPPDDLLDKKGAAAKPSAGMMNGGPGGRGAGASMGKGPRGKLMGAEKAETGEVKWSVYFIYLKHLSFPVAAGVFVLYVCSNTAAIGTNLWLGQWSQDAGHPDRLDSNEWRDYRLSIYAVLGFVHGFFILISALVLAFGQNQASRRQHEGMLRRIMRAPMSFFDTTPLGRIVNRFSRDVDVVDSMIPINFRMWLNCVFNVVATITVICISTPIFATVILPLAVLYYLIQRFYIPSNRQLKRLHSVAQSPVYSHFQESLTGSNLIIATRSTDRFTHQNELLMDSSNKSYFPTLISQRWLALRVELLGTCITMFAALFAVVGRDKGWNIDAKDIGLSISYAMSVTATLNFLVNVASNLEANIVSVERLKEYSEVPVEAPWVVEERRPSKEWPERGHIQFNGYQTRYRPGLGLVLKGITCDIAEGERVGIVGRTGAGKSSLTLALFRIIEGTSGSIVIDGIDISEIGLHDLRERITIIPQEPVLFSGTLRINLDPFSLYSDEDLWWALENAHLKVFVSSLPAGLQHPVAEGGDNLSIGQRQLICLARALLRKSKILVMDEATAAIDLETDALIQQTIREKFVDCSVLTIAHRLNTIMDSTRVLVLDDGFVKEFDTPSNLLANPASVFYGLAESANLLPLHTANANRRDEETDL